MFIYVYICSYQIISNHIHRGRENMYSEDNVQRECMLRHWSWAKSMSSGTVNISIYHNISQMISIYLNLSHIVQWVLIGVNSIPISTNIAKHCDVLPNIAKYCKATWLFRSQKRCFNSAHGSLAQLNVSMSCTQLKHKMCTCGFPAICRTFESFASMRQGSALLCKIL